MAPGGSPALAKPLRPIRAVRMRDAFGDPGYRRIIADPGFNAIPFTSPLADLMARILGRHTASATPSRSPGSCTRAASFRGNPAISSTRTTGRCRTCSPAGFPLATSRILLGGLAVLPGSQHTSQVSHYPLSSSRTRLADDGLPGRRRARLPLPDHSRRTAEPRRADAVLRRVPLATRRSARAAADGHRAQRPRDRFPDVPAHALVAAGRPRPRPHRRRRGQRGGGAPRCPLAVRHVRELTHRTALTPTPKLPLHRARRSGRTWCCRQWRARWRTRTSTPPPWCAQRRTTPGWRRHRCRARRR